MYRPITIFISLRYTYERTADRFTRIVSWFPMIGIILGVMSLIVVLSVMKGFERELKNSTLEYIPQAIILSKTGSVNPQQLSENNFIKIKGIYRILPLTFGEVILQSSYNVSFGSMMGIDPERKEFWTSYLVNVDPINLKSGKYNVIIGNKLAEQLGVYQGDQLRVIVPSINHFTPIGQLLNQRLFNLIGTFSTKSEVDEYQILVHIRDASRLMRYPKDNITGWRLWLKDPLKIKEFDKQILPFGTELRDWSEHKGELFQAIRMEKNVIGLLLSLMIIVSTFNIFASLGLIILEKKSEIAILKTQGLTSNRIMLIFIIQGVVRGIIGVVVGTIMGMFLSKHVNELMKLIGLSTDGIVIPVFIEIKQIISIDLIVIGVSVLSTLYPSWYAASMQPTKALRYE